MFTTQGRPNLASQLASVPLLRNLSAPARTLLLAEGKVRRYAPGAQLWTAGRDAVGIFIVLRGRVRVVRAPRGRQHTIHSEGPGGTLGDVPFFAGGPYPATALAAEATECLILSQGVVRRLIAMDPDFALGLLAQLAGRVRTLVQRLDERVGMSVQQRLARLVLARSELANGAPFTLGATQAQAAEELATVREVLVRELRRLRDAGAIRSTSRGRYAVANVRLLRDLARARRFL